MSENRLGLAGIMGLILATLCLALELIPYLILTEGYVSNEDAMLAIALLVFGLLGLIGSIGLIYKVNWCRLLVNGLLILMLMACICLLGFVIYYNINNPLKYRAIAQICISIGFSCFVLAAVILINHVEVRKEFGLEDEL